jgi:hypothetical protein
VVPPFLRRRRSLPPSQDRYRQRRSPSVLPFSIGMSFDLCPDCYAFLPWLACVCAPYEMRRKSFGSDGDGASATSFFRCLCSLIISVSPDQSLFFSKKSQKQTYG